MPGEETHALKVALATALRERDTAREDASYFKASYARKLEDEKRLLESAAATVEERDALRERDDAARAMLTQLRAALDEDSTFLGAVLRVEMDKWLATGGDRG